MALVVRRARIGRCRGTAALALAAGLLAACLPVAHDERRHTMEHAWRQALARPALAASAAFDGRGRLWRATVEAGHVLVSYSDDLGRRFGAPLRVNGTPEHIAADGESRPKVAVAPDGTVYVSYTAHGTRPFSGHIRLARSTDGGRTFSVPLTVNDDRAEISHRFEAIGVDGLGRVHVVWIDKRDQAAAAARGAAYAGAAVYHTVSEDRGATFGPNRKLADHSCECCRLALDLDADGTPVALWRHVFEGKVRDHALQRLDGASPLRRVARDGWEVEACPHHGPALAVGADGVYHAAWFSGAPGRTGLLYARSTDRGANFSAPLAFGNPDAQAGHPAVLARGREVHLAWKEFDGQAAVVRAMRSTDRGASFTPPRTVARSAGPSDHPLLIGRGDAVYLSWATAKDGYRLVALP